MAARKRRWPPGRCVGGSDSSGVVARSQIGAREDHAAGSGLQHLGHCHVERRANVAAAILHDDHGAVVQIAHALPYFLAFLNDLDTHRFARQEDQAHGVGQFVDVEDRHALNLGHAIEVIVVGEHGALQALGQRDELVVDFADFVHIHVGNAQGTAGVFLHPIENVQPPAAAVAAQRVRRIGDVLQLVQDEARHQQRAAEETGAADVGDAPVDDDGSIQQHRALVGQVGGGLGRAQRQSAGEELRKIPPPAAQGGHAQQAKHDRRNHRQNLTERRGQQGQRK